MGASLTAADLRATDFLLGVLVAFAVMIGSALLLVHVGGRESVVPTPIEPEVIAVRSVEAAPAKPKKPAPEPVVEQVEPAVVPAIDRPRSRPRPHARPVAAAAPPPPTATTGGPSEVDGTDTEGDDGEALVAAYRSTLRNWIAARVRIRDTGLEASELDGKRVRLNLEIDEERTIVHATIVPTGTAAFDRGALAALDAITGQTLPAPPEGYPGPLQRRIPILFVCKPGACR